MASEIKVLMDDLIKRFGGSFERSVGRTYWNAPTGERIHISTVFLRRMKRKPSPTQEIQPIEQQREETLDESPKQSVVESTTPELPEQGGAEKIEETSPQGGEEGVVIEPPKKKKKSSKKKTKSKVEVQEEQEKNGNEVSVEETPEESQ